MDGGGNMAIAAIVDLAGMTEAQYTTVMGMLGTAMPPGNLVHIAGPTEDGWRIVDVWESAEAMDAFFRSAPAAAAFQAAGVAPTQPDVFSVSGLAVAAATKRH
jgi:hypothetical protein